MNRERKFNLYCAILLVAAALFSRGHAIAADDDAASSAEREIRALIDTQTQELSRNFPGRIEVSVGSLAGRPNLAACTKIEPFMPNGARLWGRSHIGLRCREGASWQIFLPVEVRIHASVPVAERNLAAGHELTDDDWRIAEVELTREPPGVLAIDPRLIAGRVAARPIAAGGPIRSDQLKARPVIGQGDTVKVVYLGSGFSVAADGTALAAAADGQSVRVQMESGRIVAGTARSGRRVEVR